MWYVLLLTLSKQLSRAILQITLGVLLNQLQFVKRQH